MSTPLYEQYRERFPDVVRSLETARRSGRLSHAFLLVADSDRTRSEFALVLALIGACVQAGETGMPCGECRVCRQILTGNYSELFPLRPVGKMYEVKIGDRVNPEPNTLRHFEKQFHLTGTAGGSRKIGVIYDADRMNDESQNALLKTLEEPPRDTMLILATGNPGALLPTTRSRCQMLPLRENRCRYDFAGCDELIAALNRLVAQRGDLGRAEECAATLCRVAGGLNAEATARAAAEWEQKVAAASQSGDAALQKRVEAQAADAGYGAYRKERSQFLSAIHTFAAQLFQLSCGVPFAQLANPEFLPDGPSEVPVELGSLVLREADDLLFTLLFNVNEELALRTFAVNVSMKNPSM